MYGEIYLCSRSIYRSKRSAMHTAFSTKSISINSGLNIVVLLKRVYADPSI